MDVQLLKAAVALSPWSVGITNLNPASNVSEKILFSAVFRLINTTSYTLH